MPNTVRIPYSIFSSEDWESFKDGQIITDINSKKWKIIRTYRDYKLWLSEGNGNLILIHFDCLNKCLVIKDNYDKLVPFFNKLD